MEERSTNGGERREEIRRTQNDERREIWAGRQQRSERGGGMKMRLKEEESRVGEFG